MRMLKLPIEELKRLYLDEKKSANEIGKMFGTSHKSIINILRRHGVETRGVKEAAVIRGSTVTPESARKISLANKGKKKAFNLTEEQRLRLSLSRKKQHELNPKGSGWGLVIERIRKNGGTPQELLLDSLLKEHGLVYEREHKVFCPEKRVGGRRYYAIDFAFLKQKIAIEIDGSSHNQENDRKRDTFLKSKGWRVYRFKNNEVEETPQKVVDFIIKLLKEGDSYSVRTN